jgi:predicted membrane chloride channel (bestrophin family)|tara:strand:- start:22 stop:426 length:405 start_codon:yes stop_codon:yes gene_type:complete
MSKRFFKKIIARSEQDLRVISALCEKSKARIDQIKFLKENKIFILMLERKLNEENNSKNIQSIIKCEYVNNVKSKKIIQTHKEKVLDLFAIDSHKFDKKYMISFYFNKKAIITIDAEIIEITLEDQKFTNDKNN